MAKEKRQITLTGPGGIKLALDKDEYFPDDPGAGTPAMVYGPFYKGSATYDCAIDTGELDNSDGYYDLNERQTRWLEEQRDLVNEFIGW